MKKNLLKWFGDIWRKYVVDDYPGDPICFDCTKSSCEGCTEKDELDERKMRIVVSPIRAIVVECPTCKTVSHLSIMDFYLRGAPIQKMEVFFKCLKCGKKVELEIVESGNSSMLYL